MKKLIIITIWGACWCGACTGDHSSNSGRDTVENRYGTEVNDTTNAADRTIDTAKVTTTTGDAPNIDNSASGGTAIAKDTLSRKKIKK